MKKIYLAGPEVFYPNVKSLGETKKDLCKKYGFIGLFPMDNVVGPNMELPDRAIYAGDVAMMDEADLGIFNLTPFRGISADPGTVFELGYFVGCKKPVFAYTEDYSHYLQRARRLFDLEVKDGGYYTPDGCFVEDHKNIDNLMIDNGVRTTSIIYNNFERCLFAAQQYYTNIPL